MLGLGNLQGKTHWIGAKQTTLFRRQQRLELLVYIQHGEEVSTSYIYINTIQYNRIQ